MGDIDAHNAHLPRRHCLSGKINPRYKLIAAKVTVKTKHAAPSHSRISALVEPSQRVSKIFIGDFLRPG
jgi:hypothetical protein